MGLTSPKFFLMQAQDEEAGKYALEIVDTSIWLRRVSVSPSVALAHSRLLQSGRNMIFPATYLESSSFSIPQGSWSFKFENIFQQNRIPQALFVFFVKAAAIAGHYQKNPYVFESANLEELRCYAGSKIVPSINFKMNPSQYEVEPGIAGMYMASDLLRANYGPKYATKDSFMQGAFILGFDLTRDGNPGAEYLNTNFDASSVSLEGSFSAATAKVFASKPIPFLLSRTRLF